MSERSSFPSACVDHIHYEDDKEEERWESAHECFSSEEEERDEEEFKKKWKSILLRSKEIEEAIREIKGGELEDGELEENLKELIDLPELVEDIHAGDLCVSVGEASIHKRGSFVIQNTMRYREIVWPAMVIILNTKLGKNDKGKRLGMGNDEVLKYFNTYKAVRSQQSYGPKGHRGVSILIFEASAEGFIEAVRLSKHLEDKGTGRDGWPGCSHRVPLSSGQLNLYGYMAEKHDMDKFNKYAQGESKLKFEMRSYQEMVVNTMKQTSEDYYLLNWYTEKVTKGKQNSKTLEKSFGNASETKLHREQDKDEMGYEAYLKHQEELFGKLLQETRDDENSLFSKGPTKQ